MTNIFTDTSAFVALMRKGDTDYKKAIEILDRLEKDGGKLVTTDYILDETYTTLLNREGYLLAIEFDRRLRRGSWRIERINEFRFVEAQKVFRRFNKDKQWSFTDCTSYVVMRELKIKKAFSFDKHFKQMGFELL